MHEKIRAEVEQFKKDIDSNNPLKHYFKLENIRDKLGPAIEERYAECDSYGHQKINLHENRCYYGYRTLRDREPIN